MITAPVYGEMDFHQRGGECWWLRVVAHRMTVVDLDRWCVENGVTLKIIEKDYDDRFVRWVGFPIEDDALLFYMAHA